MGNAVMKEYSKEDKKLAKLILKFDPKRMREVFNEADQDKSGFLDMKEGSRFIAIMADMMRYETEKDMKADLRWEGKSGAEFKKEYDERMLRAAITFEGYKREAGVIFDFMDVDRNGKISFEEFETFVTNLLEEDMNQIVDLLIVTGIVDDLVEKDLFKARSANIYFQDMAKLKKTDPEEYEKINWRVTQEMIDRFRERWKDKLS
jgi:Ca2+-binding EF-hand superfamily protein